MAPTFQTAGSSRAVKIFQNSEKMLSYSWEILQMNGFEPFLAAFVSSAAPGAFRLGTFFFALSFAVEPKIVQENKN